MPNAKIECQPLSKNAKFEEFGTKNAKLATLRVTFSLLFPERSAYCLLLIAYCLYCQKS